jgi:hypothetical protein
MEFLLILVSLIISAEECYIIIFIRLFVCLSVSILLYELNARWGGGDTADQPVSVPSTVFSSQNVNTELYLVTNT